MIMACHYYHLLLFLVLTAIDSSLFIYSSDVSGKLFMKYYSHHCPEGPSERLFIY